MACSLLRLHDAGPFYLPPHAGDDGVVLRLGESPQFPNGRWITPVPKSLKDHPLLLIVRKYVVDPRQGFSKDQEILRAGLRRRVDIDRVGSMPFLIFDRERCSEAGPFRWGLLSPEPSVADTAHGAKKKSNEVGFGPVPFS